MLAESMLTLAVPVFVTLIVWVDLLPTVTVPKLIVVALGVKTPPPPVPGLPCECALVSPAQLDRPITARMEAKEPSQMNTRLRAARWLPQFADGA
jgi:hypothetical protein